MPLKRKIISHISSLNVSKHSGGIQVLSFLGFCIGDTNVGNIDADENDDCHLVEFPEKHLNLDFLGLTCADFHLVKRCSQEIHHNLQIPSLEWNQRRILRYWFSIMQTYLKEGVVQDGASISLFIHKVHCSLYLYTVVMIAIGPKLFRNFRLPVSPMKKKHFKMFVKYPKLKC